MPRNRSNKKTEIEIKKVSDDSDEISFTLIVKGKWSWNRDFAFAPNSFDGSSPLLGYEFAEEETFRNSFQRFIANKIFDRCENMFETVGVSDMDVSGAVLKAFADWRMRNGLAKKASALAELEAAEARVKELREKL